MGFDPEVFFRRRPRVVRPMGPRMSRGRVIGLSLLALVILLLVVSRTLLGMRVDYLFLSTMGHANVFWTPVVAQVVLFLIGFALTAALLALNLPAWRRTARYLDELGPRLALIAGLIVVIVGGIAGGAFLASQWQDVLLWQHGKSFGATDPVFGQDYSFYVFTLPVLDDLQAIGWGVAIVSLLSAIGMGMLAVAAANTPTEVPLPLRPPAGRSAADAVPLAARHAGVVLVAIFILAALGAHYGAYHLMTSTHDSYNFVGMDATQRNIVRPVLGISQWLALLFAVVTAVAVGMRWRRPAPSLGGGLAGALIGWLVLSAIIQFIPPAIYEAAYATPNAQTAQLQPITDFLTSSRNAWDLNTQDVENRNFASSVVAPTVADLAEDPGTLTNVRLQDYRQLPDTLAQIDRTRNYQTYPTITVDRYPSTTGGDVEVMLGPREIDSTEVSSGFVNQNLIYTHGYGFTAVSVNRVNSSGTPYIYAGGTPASPKVAADAPPDLAFGATSAMDGRIYCGVSSNQPPVVVDTQTPEFDYPSQSGDQFARPQDVADVRGIAVSNPIDRLAMSFIQFGGTELLLTNQLTPQSRALIHRDVSERVQTLAPFLTLDADPYIVVDPQTKHLMYVVDGYLKTDRFPNSYQLSDGTSYMRNAVKAVVDAKTCDTTLYAVDDSEPLTQAYEAIYPGLLTPFAQMPTILKQHLRYPEDLFKAQAEVYAQVHVANANVFFNGSDRFRIAQERVGAGTDNQPTQPYYVELTLPGDDSASFVLLQTFSPGSGANTGGGADNMTAWLAAQCDYTKSAHPTLVAVRLNNAANVLGPLQFEKNLNTNPTISKDISLLNQGGSQVILGNVIVLPFNNHSFLYVRPLYVAATGGGSSFPQLQRVLVGTRDGVAEGNTFPDALQALFNTTAQIPGLAPSQSTTPGSPTPTPAPGKPTTQTVSSQVIALVQDLLNHQAAAQADFQKGDFAAYGREQAAIAADATQLRQLLASVTPAPSPATSPTTSPS